MCMPHRASQHHADAAKADTITYTLLLCSLLLRWGLLLRCRLLGSLLRWCLLGCSLLLLDPLLDCSLAQAGHVVRPIGSRVEDLCLLTFSRHPIASPMYSAL